MRPLAVLLLLVALVATGCSKSNPNAPAPDRRGTPLGATGTFGTPNEFLWSASTNEIVGTAAFFTGTLPYGALIAMNGASGASRVLDAENALFPLAGSSGNPVYYGVIRLDHSPAGNDSMGLRRVSLTGGAPIRIDDCAGLCFYLHAVSADGAWLAWASLGSDSLVIESTSSGARTRIEPGFPILMSPDGSQLLYVTDAFSAPVRRLHDRAAGTSVPFDLGLPTDAPAAGLRWDASGLHVLYVQSGRQLWVRHIGNGVTEHLYSYRDSLQAVSGTWSPDGARVALWSDAASGTEHTLTLHVVDVAGKSGSAVAVGSVSHSGRFPLDLGGIVFSPDSRRVAYQYGDALFTSPVPGVAASTLATATMVDGRALQTGAALDQAARAKELGYP